MSIFNSTDISWILGEFVESILLHFPFVESYYSCYYPESEAFRQQVAAIVNKFRANGYNVIMDAMVSHEISSLGPTKWAEVQIRKAKKVLVFLSPGLLKLSLGYEGMPRSEVECN